MYSYDFDDFLRVENTLPGVHKHKLKGISIGRFLSSQKVLLFQPRSNSNPQKRRGCTSPDQRLISEKFSTFLSVPVY